MGAKLGATPIPLELAVADRDGRVRRAITQNTIFVLNEFDSFHRKISSFLSDTGAIFVGNASARQRKISNRHIIAEYHKYPLSHACFIRNDDAGADTLDYKIVGAPNSAVNVCVC